jgi:abortive infection bacteriophage resistance protein
MLLAEYPQTGGFFFFASMNPHFSKPALTYAEQLARLEKRGMVIADRARAEFYLAHLNYYRLVGYWLPFELDHTTHEFRPGTTFEDVLNLYVFDRELRLLVLDAIERVEVSVRSRWAYELAHAHGPHGYLDAALAADSDRYDRNLESLQEEVRRSDEAFIRHFRDRYAEALPPVWAVCEVMSLGQLSKWFSNLRPMKTRAAIASGFRLDERTLQSWLHHLSYVRNVCAHHSRLWDREFRITPAIPKTKPAALAAQLVLGSRRSYNTLTILLYLLNLISPAHQWRSRLIALIDAHAVDHSRMGFPGNWQSFALWS